MAIDKVSHHLPAAPPPGARVLGQRVKPIIRLGMGVKVAGHRRDGSEFTRPEKTDYFTVRGDERAVKKFVEVYGEKPKAVKIMVPSSLELALNISYKSFIGGGDEGDGGRPLALGMTNFAPLGYVGGPDVLRVWKQDGSYIEVETAGLDELGKPLDEIANDLKIEVQATFTFTIPDVLGWGSFVQVHSKGKKTADNLTFKLTEIYSAFGAKAPWAFSGDDPPLLVLKPDTALMRMEDRDTHEARWAKTKIFVLDIVIPESFADMQERLIDRQRELEGRGGAVAELYGPGEPAAEPPTEPQPATPREEGSQQAAAAPGSPETPAAAAPGHEPIEDGEWEEAVDNGNGAAPTDEQIAAAAATAIPGGVHKDKTLDQLAGEDGGQQWLLTQLKKLKPGDRMRAPIETFTRGRLPELWTRFETWKAEQS